jgi:ribosomal protein S18 acetylase RimI-like enzyme
MIEKQKIHFNDSKKLEDLKNFIDNNIKGCENFRYYKHRDFNTIKNHLQTILYYQNDECVGYGHLDKENEKVWLGIIVADNHQFKGFGNLIMDDLISRYEGEIYLSVDKGNINAQGLYKKKSFIILEENDKNYIMILKQ